MYVGRGEICVGEKSHAKLQSKTKPTDHIIMNNKIDFFYSEVWNIHHGNPGSITTPKNYR